MVINKFPNREVYEKIKEKGSLGADDVNVLEDYPGLEWKGEYSSTATYVKGDIVYYENMLYVMVSASVIGAIPGIDNDWIDFAKRSVTSSDVTNALGFTPADSTKVLPLSGGTLTGNLTGKYITGTWLQATDAGHLATTPTKIPVFDDEGWIYYRTPAEILKDIGASSGSGGALKAMSAVNGHIGIPAAELPENGIVWMCIADGEINQEYYSGTITMQGGAMSNNNIVSISSNGVIQLNQVVQVSDGIAIYGMSVSAYTGVYQVVGAEGDSGENLSLGMTSAAVGQIAKIAAVDADGKPIAWSPVDIPSGGGGDWITIVDLTLTVAASISQSVSLIGYAEVIVQFEMPKVDAEIQGQGSESPISTAGLYYEKIGSTNYPWRYTAHAWLDRDGNIVNSIIAFGPSSGVGQKTNVCTQAKPKGTIGSVFRIVPEMPSGTKLKILAK